MTINPTNLEPGVGAPVPPDPNVIKFANGRGTIALTWLPGRRRPVATLTLDGVRLAAEALDLASPNARKRLADEVPASATAEVAAALLNLADASPPPSPSKTGNADTVGALIPPVEQWPVAVDPADVLASVVARIARHLHLPPHAAEVLAAWLLLTYLLDVLPVAPILWAHSPTRGCGKSVLLDLVALLAARALKSENATLAALFRLAEAHRATLVLDEIDQWLIGDRHGEVSGLLNASFTRGARFLRTVGDDNEPRAFDVFSFRAVAGIGHTLHDTTRSRAYRIPMERAPSGHLPVPLQTMHAESWASPMRQQLARAAAQLSDGLADRLSDPDAVAYPEHLDGRARDLWVPLLALGAELGNGWAEQMHEACIAMTTADSANEADIGVMLLSDTKRHFDEIGTGHTTPGALLAWLIAIEGSVWGEYKQGKPLSPRGLSTLLKRFGIAPEAPTRREGGKLRWLNLEQFEAAWARYLPADDPAPVCEASGEVSQASLVSLVSHKNGTPGTAGTEGTRNNPPAIMSHDEAGPGMTPPDEDDGYWLSLVEEAA